MRLSPEVKRRLLTLAKKSLQEATVNCVALGITATELDDIMKCAWYDTTAASRRPLKIRMEDE